MAYQNSEKNRWMPESMNSSLKELILDPLHNTPKEIPDGLKTKKFIKTGKNSEEYVISEWEKSF